MLKSPTHGTVMPNYSTPVIAMTNYVSILATAPVSPSSTPVATLPLMVSELP